MKTILKLLIAAIIINGSARAGFASVQYFQFKEAAQQAVLFGGGRPTAEVRRAILERAQELDVPVQPENVLVRRQGGRTWADASYIRAVEVFPNQPYPVDFSFSVESYSTVGGPP
jgi:hypothetical protein